MRKPVDYKAADITAIQQLAEGKAGPEMQKRALDWIINTVCMTYDQSFVEDTHGTAFNEGSRFCGNTIVKMLKLNPAKVRSDEDG